MAVGCSTSKHWHVSHVNYGDNVNKEENSRIVEQRYNTPIFSMSFARCLGAKEGRVLAHVCGFPSPKQDYGKESLPSSLN